MNYILKISNKITRDVYNNYFKEFIKTFFFLICKFMALKDNVSGHHLIITKVKKVKGYHPKPEALACCKVVTDEPVR